MYFTVGDSGIWYLGTTLDYIWSDRQQMMESAEPSDISRVVSIDYVLTL